MSPACAWRHGVPAPGETGRVVPRGRKCRALDANWEMGSRSLPVFRPRFVVPGIRRVNPSCVDELAPFKRGKCFDGFSYLLLGEPQVVETL